MLADSHVANPKTPQPEISSILFRAPQERTLAAMNWRRGMRLVAIHLAIALPLILWRGARDLRVLSSDTSHTAGFRPVAMQEGGIDADGLIRRRRAVIQSTEYPPLASNELKVCQP
jgi:hypothetical protein